jgi:hypothetical protein
MQIPILSGIYADGVADFRTAYPVNMVPVPKGTGISSGYLRPAEGAIRLDSALGLPRGGIEWKGQCFRVMGENLVRIASNGALTIIGSVGPGGRCSFDYSFDYLAVTSGGRLYYWDGLAFTQVTDPDLGLALAVVWVDGYFMTTDGTSLVVTELINPFSVDPLKYGSSEIDPDPIKTVLKVRNEVHAVNRYTIEVFDDIGGDLFPFERISGAQIQKGAVGTFAACVFGEYLAFLGSGRNEAPGIYLGVNATANKISTREIDTLLAGYPESDLSIAVLEARAHADHQHLWIRLPDRTLVYDLAASKAIGEPIWYQLTSSQIGFEKYRAVDLIYCYDSWLVADSATGDYGYLSLTTAHHFGGVVRWEFSTAIAYNEGRGAIFNSLELICLSGRVEPGEDPYISTCYSVDGETWSQEKYIRTGIQGDRLRRIAWLQQGHMLHWRVQRFSGDSRSQLSIARLEAGLEPLTV